MTTVQRSKALILGERCDGRHSYRPTNEYPRLAAKPSRRVLCLVVLPLRGLIMPTDLRVMTERERKATQPETQTAITILLVFVIISLVMLVLLFLDPSFSKASIELMGRLAS